MINMYGGAWLGAASAVGPAAGENCYNFARKTESAGFSSLRNTSRSRALLCSTALGSIVLCSTAFGGLLAILAATAPAQAQQIIDGGTTVIVPDTQPSPWTIGNILYVGQNSAGTLTIHNGGAVSNTTGYIGYNSGSDGNVTVDGTGSTWTNSSSLYVGRAGNGSLSITGGGAVSNFSSGIVGSVAGSNGAVAVTGAGSTWSTSSDLSVGSSGTGTLNISGGGAVSNNYGYVGASQGSNGRVTVDGAGSTWTNSGNLSVGYEGTGTMIITNGAVVTSAVGRSDIGYWETGNGTVEVSGAGSKWTVSGYLTVGLLGIGSLSITNGGAVSDTFGYVGNKTAAHGDVTVDGAGSTWSETFNLYVGTETGSSASMRITNGGAVSSLSGIVAINGGSQGDITIDGAGSKWTNSSDFELGRAGTGTMSITNGAVLSDANGNIANNPSGTATVTVDGAGSTWTNNGNLYVAAGAIVVVPGGGHGTLTISNGGTVSAVNVQLGSDTMGRGIINIGAAQGEPAVAPGTLNASTVDVRNFGTLVFNHTDTTGGYFFTPAILGTGNVEHIAGTTILTGASTYSGPTNVAGGTLRAGVADTFSSNSAVTVADVGTLDLNGFSQTVASLTNAGLVNMGTGTAAGTVLTTTNYVGQGGMIAMNTFLGDDTSPSDRLVINGGTASGNSLLHFTNAGGPGAQTTANGILVVDAINNGTTEEGAFAMANPQLRGGAYDYRLFQGGLNGSDPDNWYLRSTFVVEPPGPPPPEPPPPVTPPEILPPEPPGPGPGTFPIIGPELATYGVVQPMAQQLGRAMLGTHDERLGDLYRPLCEPAETNAPYSKAPVYTKAPVDCGAYGWHPAVWGRLFGQQIDNHYQAFADPRADGQIAGLQAGVDVLRNDNLFAGHRDYAGFYAAYGNANVDVTGLVTNAAATGYVLQHTGHLNLDAYSGGVYWTHYGVPGWYVDLVLQGTSYGGAASTEFARLNTNGSGFISSLEGGYPIALPMLGPGFVLEPQAQVLWQWVSFDAGNDGLGPVALGTSSATTARVGVKGKWTITTDSGQVWQPYVRVNFWSDFGPSSATLFGPDIAPLISHTQYMDVDAGFTTRINTHLSAFADAGYQFAVSNDGGGKRNGVKASAGLRYQW